MRVNTLKMRKIGSFDKWHMSFSLTVRKQKQLFSSNFHGFQKSDN